MIRDVSMLRTIAVRRKEKNATFHYRTDTRITTVYTRFQINLLNIMFSNHLVCGIYICERVYCINCFLISLSFSLRLSFDAYHLYVAQRKKTLIICINNSYVSQNYLKYYTSTNNVFCSYLIFRTPDSFKF